MFLSMNYWILRKSPVLIALSPKENYRYISKSFLPIKQPYKKSIMASIFDTYPFQKWTNPTFG